MELTHDQIALLAGLGTIAVSVMLMTLSYYLGQSLRNRQVIPRRTEVTGEVASEMAPTTRRSRAA